MKKKRKYYKCAFNFCSNKILEDPNCDQSIFCDECDGKYLGPVKRLCEVGDIITSPHLLNNERYIVENTTMEGGGTAMWNDNYPDVPCVYARKLGKDDEYNPKGKLVRFYQGQMSYEVSLSNPEFLGNKKKVVDFI